MQLIQGHNVGQKEIWNWVVLQVNVQKPKEIIKKPKILYFHFIILPDTHQYCWQNGFNATCNENEVILMEHAHYGRMRDSHCLTSTAHLGCYADVLPQLDARCSGHRSCKVIFYRPQTKLRDGNVFTRVCLFTGGSAFPQCYGAGKHPLYADTPSQLLPRQTSAPPPHPEGTSCQYGHPVGGAHPTGMHTCLKLCLLSVFFDGHI